MTSKDERAGRRAARRTDRERAQKRHTTLIGVAGLVVVAALAVVGLLASGALGSGSTKASVAPTSWSTQAYTGGPRLAVDRTTVDDGTVDYGHQVNAVYRLKNVGDQALNLQEATVDPLEGC